MNHANGQENGGIMSGARVKYANGQDNGGILPGGRVNYANGQDNGGFLSGRERLCQERLPLREPDLPALEPDLPALEAALPLREWPERRLSKATASRLAKAAAWPERLAEAVLAAWLE